MSKTLSGTRRREVAALAALFCLASVALAQQQIRQDGRLLERNPQVGSGGLNYVQQAYQPFGGNLTATGNVRGGFALRSPTAISDPSAFRASLGSSSLSNFLRDSVSVSDAYSAYGDVPLAGLGRSAFFDPVRTAPTARQLQYGAAGAASPGYGAYSRPGAGPGVYSLGRNTPGLVQYSGLNPVGVGEFGSGGARSRVEVPGRYVAPELSSSVFGVPLRGAAPAAGDWRSMLASRGSQPQTGAASRFGVPAGDGVGDAITNWSFPGAELADDETAGVARRVLERDPTDLLTRRSTLGRMLEREARIQGDSDADAAPQLGWGARPAPRAASASDESDDLTPSRPAYDPTTLPGHDLFTDMQLSVAMEDSPDRAWLDQMQESIAAPAAPAADAAAATGDAADAGADPLSGYLSKLSNARITSFAGPTENDLNMTFRRAEAAMERREYYLAAQQYQFAAGLAPTNPLPLIGQGHAYLAAGEYGSAAEFLVRGLERYPDVARFKVDLIAMLGGGETVDIRRADLKRMLEDLDDSRLRFLLGYLEYHGGLKDQGLANLDAAAKRAPIGSIIQRYPALLRHYAKPDAP